MHDRIQELQDGADAAAASYSVLFLEPQEEKRVARPATQQAFCSLYWCLLSAMRQELATLSNDLSSSRRLYTIVDDTPDSIDYLNQIALLLPNAPLSDVLQKALWEALSGFLPDADESNKEKDAGFVYRVQHTGRLLAKGITTVQDYMELLAQIAPPDPAGLSRLAPIDYGPSATTAQAVVVKDGRLTPETLRYVEDNIRRQDMFSEGQTFRAVGDRIIAAPIGAIRAISGFYGYAAEKRLFANYFWNFAKGRKTEPLLITGMPGLGKTHLTLAYATSFPELTVILADQEQLRTGFETLMTRLARHHYRRFVVFFDDIDPDEEDWTLFRYHVDGYMPGAKNVAIVVASNRAFPDRIRSRSRLCELKPMSPESCKEMVRDYFRKHRGMTPQDESMLDDLASVTAADYVDQLRFGRINELTPRSLVRYFEELDTDTAKLRRLIAESAGKIVRSPDDSLFADHNRRMLELMEEHGQG